jgi:hypothetical protein
MTSKGKVGNLLALAVLSYLSRPGTVMSRPGTVM